MIDKALNALYKNKITLSEYREIEDICSGRENTTISEKVANFFRRNKANVKEQGIGWVIKI